MIFRKQKRTVFHQRTLLPSPRASPAHRLPVHCLLEGFFYAGSLRLVVALGRLRCLVPEKLLEKLLSRSLVRQLLGDGMPQEVRVEKISVGR